MTSGLQLFGPYEKNFQIFSLWNERFLSNNSTVYLPLAGHKILGKIDEVSSEAVNSSIGVG